MEKLGHSNQEIRKRYIGITQEEIPEHINQIGTQDKGLFT